MSHIVVAANIQLVSPCRQHDTHTSNTVPQSPLARRVWLWLHPVQGDCFYVPCTKVLPAAELSGNADVFEKQNKCDLLHAARSRLTFACRRGRSLLWFSLLFGGTLKDIFPCIDQRNDTIRRVFARSHSLTQYIRSQTTLDFNFIKEFSGNGAAV